MSGRGGGKGWGELGGVGLLAFQLLQGIFFGTCLNLCRKTFKLVEGQAKLHLWQLPPQANSKMTTLGIALLHKYNI